MGIFKSVALILICVQAFVFENKNHILYLMQTKEYDKAISNYQSLLDETKKQDFEILQQIALILLENGVRSPSADERQMAVFGAGIAGSEKSLKILEKGLFAPEMAVQLTALHFLSAYQENSLNELLVKAMSSDFLQTRIEAAYQMAKKKHPCAFGQIDSLMQRMPPFFKPFFPQFFALIGNSDAINVLKSLLFDSDASVCIQSILSIAQEKRDDLLYLLRRKLKHGTVGEKEAATYALSSLSDSASIDLIKNNAASAQENLQLASYIALYNLGLKTYSEDIIKMAVNGNVFATLALGKIPGSENVLSRIASSPDSMERINASIALLMLKDPRCLLGLKELLIKKENGLIIQPFYSVGRSLLCYNIMPFTGARKDLDPNLSFDIKEHLLKEALELNEDAFLKLSNAIFENNQNDLVAMLTHLLENKKSERAMLLLKKYAQKSGAPLIRDYCNLALYRAGEDGPYFKYLKDWMKRNSKVLVRLKPFSPTKVQFEKSQYELSSDEASRLMLEIFVAVAEKHDVEGINLLLESIKNTGPINRYPLAGILLRATE